MKKKIIDLINQTVAAIETLPESNNRTQLLNCAGISSHYAGALPDETEVKEEKLRKPEK